MRRIRRQLLESALTELAEFLEGEVDSEGVCFALGDDVPSFSIAEFLMPHLGTTKDFAGVKVIVPESVRLVMDANSEWPCRASFDPPITARYRGKKIFGCSVYGFTEHADRYVLDISWAGAIPIPISITKPGH